MKHHFRTDLIKEIEGELGSGVVDKNGVEIFEGDRLRGPDDSTGVVRFTGGRFILDYDGGYFPCEELAECLYLQMEVIGHM